MMQVTILVVVNPTDMLPSFGLLKIMKLNINIDTEVIR